VKIFKRQNGARQNGARHTPWVGARHRAIWAGAAVVLVLLLLAGIFLCRRPVILVSDRPFNLLYGENRVLIRRLTLSLSLFRLVKTVNIAGGAGPDLAAQAAAGLSRRPYGVFFPYRYREGARRYLKDRPGFPVFILGGRMEQDRPPSAGQDETEEPSWFFTDTRTDLYRAGVLAGFLAQAGKAPPAFDQKGLESDKIEAFVRGLKDQDWLEEPLFPPFSEQMPKPACVVLQGKGDPYLYEWPEASLLLFTWTNPAFLPRRTLAIFDDSPWAQLETALELFRKGGGGGLISSQIRFPGPIKELKQRNFDIKGLKTLKYEPINTDN
jgi:hypothetical protein